jgi:hypothetical protein
MHLSRARIPVAIAIGAGAFALAGFAAGAAAQRGATETTCTNTTSGTNWQIAIDYDRSTVDSNPARISDAQITWHDAKDNGNYTLDRKTGNLTIIVASSTGGAFFYHRCKLDN